MGDQANVLRRQLLKSQGKLAKSVAIVSGKGGVGKSNFTTNLAYTLISNHKRVILIDMDIGMGNVHILLGMMPQHSLKEYLDGSIPLRDVIYETPEGIQFISGGSGLDRVMEWNEVMFARLLHAFEKLQQEYDYILFDMGAGATQSAVELVLSVDEIIVISTTEPTSITDAYSMMKFIHLKDPDKKIHLVGNRMPNNMQENDAVVRLQFAMRKFLGKETSILGFLPEDPVVHQAVLAQKPFIYLFPNAPISESMKTLSQTFTGITPIDNLEQKEGFVKKLRNIFMRGRE